MLIKPMTRLLVGAVIALTAEQGIAMATPTTTLSFGITGLGSYTVNTGNITTITSTKTLPGIELVSGSTTTTAATEAGLSTGETVTFSTLTLNTTVGPDAFTVSAGDLILTFTNVSSALKVATGTSTNGSISEQFNGTVTGDTSVGTLFLGQSASISETCTQPGTSASITCSDSVITPGLPITTPEPISMAILGVGMFGLGVVRHRRS